MISADELRDRLLTLDRASYKAYKSIQGQYRFQDFVLIIDHVQGDPFAAPSRLRVQVPQQSPQGKPIAGFPEDTFNTHSRTVALRDYLNRQFAQAASDLAGKRGSGKSGLVAIASPSQQVLERSAIWVTDQQVEARFVVGLPAQGRRILGRQAAELLCEDLPKIVNRALLYGNLNQNALYHQLDVVEDADWLRTQLMERGLVAFIPNGAILPRQSGVSNMPLRQTCIPFQSPGSLSVTFQRPNHGTISGMGIPQGITLIVGGGYHGKSTLLRAIALGIYPHIPGDGREAVVTDPTAINVRAEDGRSIQGVDISPFINQLPQGRSTKHFTTDNASGSTSQVANIIEALEMGATLLLVDEDTSATNFMIRDRRMQALIAKDKEPITPFIDKIRQLYEDYGVSTILVMGGSGDYFDVADTVIGMDDFQPKDLTQQAKAIAKKYETMRQLEGGATFGDMAVRVVNRQSRQSSDDARGPKIKVRNTDELRLGQDDIELTAVEQIVETTQLRAIGWAIAYLQTHYIDGRQTLRDIMTLIMDDIDQYGLDALTPYPQGDVSRFRAAELAAALNRLRSLSINSQSAEATED
ncbi:MAG: ABC-ATPase domain-containing protein [Cyanobacteria bacterium P01_E01_bin.6]